VGLLNPSGTLNAHFFIWEIRRHSQEERRHHLGDSYPL